MSQVEMNLPTSEAGFRENGEDTNESGGVETKSDTSRRSYADQQC